MKSYFTSKTMWFGFAIGFVGLVQTTLGAASLEAPWDGIATAATGAVIMGLRAVTSKSVGNSA